MSYYTKITKAGLAAITTAMNNNSKVPITYMAFGDGNGYIPEPDENATSLVNEVYRVGVNKVEVHNKNPNWLVCEAIIPSAVGGFNIREVALYDSTGNTMLAIASYPPTYKPTVEEGAAKIQTIRIVIQVDNSGNFELIVDPDVVLATVEYVNNHKKNDGDILLENGRTQRERNKDELNILDFFTEAELVSYKNAPEDFDFSDAFDRAVSAASYLSRKLIGSGEFRTNRTLHIYCDTDLSCLTINSYVADVTLKVSNIDSTTLSRKIIFLPKVISKLKNGKGWDTAGNIGVQTLNLNACEITVPYIEGFKIGLNCHASNGRGNCYSNYFLMHINNNKINHQISAENDGAWTNENKFFGGRFSHLSSEGSNVIGCRHIFIKAAKHNPNQNIWFSPSIEGNIPEYHAEIQGSWNAIYSARWEAEPPKVLFSVDESLGEEYKAIQASKNLILSGYNVDGIVFRTQGNGSNFLNRVLGMVKDLNPVTANTGGSRTKNTFSDGSAIESIFSNSSNLYTAPESEYIQQKYPQGIRGKRAADPSPRIDINFNLGEMKFGNGTTDIANMAILKTIGTSSTLTINKNLVSNNAASLGSSSTLWPEVFAIKYMYSATVGDFYGVGSPEGILSAGIGSTYRRSDGAAGTAFYVKESGTGNTGWVAK